MYCLQSRAYLQQDTGDDNDCCVEECRGKMIQDGDDDIQRWTHCSDTLHQSICSGNPAGKIVDIQCHRTGCSQGCTGQRSVCIQGMQSVDTGDLTPQADILLTSCLLLMMAEHWRSWRSELDHLSRTKSKICRQCAELLVVFENTLQYSRSRRMILVPLDSITNMIKMSVCHDMLQQLRPATHHCSGTMWTLGWRPGLGVNISSHALTVLLSRLLVLAASILEPDLDHSLLETNVLCEAGALHHAGALVDAEHVLQHLHLQIVNCQKWAIACKDFR